MHGGRIVVYRKLTIGGILLAVAGGEESNEVILVGSFGPLRTLTGRCCAWRFLPVVWGLCLQAMYVCCLC
jgi:hypothetical protein